MFGLFRRSRLPAAARPPLVGDERVIGWATVVGEDDAWVVATNRGLRLPGRADLLGWHEIHKAAWLGNRLTIVPGVEIRRAAVDSAATDGAVVDYRVTVDGDAIVVRLAKPGNVPDQVRRRVTNSVASTSHHPMPGGGARIVARRVPGVDGVTWHVRYDPGVTSDDPDVVAATDELVRTAAASLTRGSDR